MKMWMLALLMVLCAALGAVTLRSAAQSAMTGPRTTGAAAATDTTPVTAAPSAPRAAPPAGAPPAAPLGGIRDDPTVAPDKGESADNNVSFPVDI